MKKKKETNKNKDIIRIDDEKLKEEEIELKKIKEKVEKQTTKDIEFIKDNNSKKEKEYNNKLKKSKISIFFLILALIAMIIYSIDFFLEYDFNNLVTVDLVKHLSFILISILIILILFKVNNKSTTPYVVLLTLVLIFYSVFSISYSKEVDVYVNDFINKNINEVIEWADKYNIKLIELHEYSDTIKKNHVIMQEYGINTLVSDVKTFKITISDGPNYDKEVVVSNLTGFSFDEVINYINENFLNNVEIEFIESFEEKDTVIEQVGSGTLKRNDLIKFIFSKGLEKEEVPVKDLKGLSLFEAVTYLKRNSINYEIKYEYSDNIEKNFIISQDITDKIVTDKLILTASRGKSIKVPDLKTMNSSDISIWASKNNIKIKYLEVYNKELPLGSIIEFDKEVNSIIDEESLLTITISKGSMIMPKVENLASFKLWANENNIMYEEVYEFSNEYKSGEIIKTNPIENTKITENDTIVITISKGKSVSVPNLVGLSKNSIQNKCKEIGLSCTFTYGSLTESTKKDISIKQSKANGTTVSEGTNVLITLSSGIYEKVSVPSFVGKTKNQISASCSSLGITCNFKYKETFSNEAKDTAISQDKTGTVIKGSVVNITLSRGQAKTYTIVIDGSLLSLGNPEQTKKTLKSKLENACPGVIFNFSFKAVNSGIGYLNPDSQVKVGSNTLTEGKTYNVIINSSN